LKFAGQKTVDRAPEELWGLLLDVEVLKGCIPGCQALDASGLHRYHLVLKVGLGPVRGRFHAEVALSDVVERESCRLELRAKGFPGSIEGAALVRFLRLDAEHRTEVAYDGDAHVHGLLRALGPKFWEDAVHAFADHFLGELSRR